VKSVVQFNVCDSGEIMVHWPNGRVQFLDWIPALKLMWELILSDVEVKCNS